MARPLMSLLSRACPEPNELGKELAPLGEALQTDELKRIVWQSGCQIASAVMHEIAHENVSLDEAAVRFVRQCLKFTADTHRAEIAAQKMEERQKQIEESES